MEAIQSRLLAGLEQMDVGFAVFDEDLRLVYCNSRYPSIRGYPPDLCQPNVALADLFLHNAKRGDYGEGDAAQQVADRIRQVRESGSIDVDQTLSNGRILSSHYRPLADGGFATTYQDVTELRRAEVILRSDRERYELVTEAISEGIYDWDIVSDTLHVTDRLNQIFGFASGELTSSDWAARVDPDDLASYATAMRDHFRGRTSRLEATYRIRDKFGAYRWIEDHAQAVRNDEGRAIRLVGAIADISDRKAAEQELRKSEERHALAMSAINEGVYDLDLQRNQIFYSNNVHKVLGLTAEELSTPVDWLNRIHPEDLPTYQGVIAAHIRGQTPRFDCEMRYRHADGTLHWARQHGTAVRDENGRAIRVVGSVGDITAEKALAEELERAQTRLAEALESISQGFALFDAEDRLVMCNTPYRCFFAETADPDIAAMLVPGMKFEDYVRKAYEKGMYPDAGDDIESYMARRLARRRNPSGGLELRLRDDTWLYVTEQRTAEGGLVALYTDITETKRREEELRAARDRAETALTDLRTAQDRLIHAEKMASLGQLTAGIAHEIKNPLNFVNNFSKLSAEMMGELAQVLEAPLTAMDEDDRDDAEDLIATVRGNLMKIDEHGRRADSIVKNMLLHSRDGGAEMQPIDLNAIALEAMNLAYHGARAADSNFNVDIESDLAPDLGLTIGQPQELQRVFLNLCSNGMYAATKHAAEGGEEPRILLRSRVDGETLIVEVEDNGGGVPEEIRDKIFQPFFTTKPTGEGTGLGLSMSYDIVRQHGGELSLKSQTGRGTTFAVRLPAPGHKIGKEAVS
jgi:PAS domain S-box-containing protein